MASAHNDDTAYLTGLVRAGDRPRYYAMLFAPAPLRPALAAVYGFAAEIARVADQVSDPTLGEIRLQWWRDGLGGAAHADEAPALRALAEARRVHRLPLAPLQALTEARSSDLYADPPASLADLEGLLGETESVIFQMAAIICGATGPDTAEAAGHAGIAYGLARRLARFPLDRHRGRLILPADLLATEGLTPQQALADPSPAELPNILAALVKFGRHHLRLATEALAGVPPRTRPAFLPLAVAEPLFRRVERLGAGLVRRPVILPDLVALTAIGRRNLRQKRLVQASS